MNDEEKLTMQNEILSLRNMNDVLKERVAELEARLNKIKAKVVENRENILKALFKNDPAPLLMQPTTAIQLVMGVRASKEMIELLDGKIPEEKDIPDYIR